MVFQCSLVEMKFIDGQKLIAERQVKKGSVLHSIYKFHYKAIFAL